MNKRTQVSVPNLSNQHSPPSGRLIATGLAIFAGLFLWGMMTNRRCRVWGCGLPARSEHAAHCSRHAAVNKRSGDPMQVPVSKKDIRPYVDRAKVLVERHAGAEEGLRLIHQTLAGLAGDTLRYRESGRPCSKWDVRAADDLKKIVQAIGAVELAAVVGGMFLLQESRPGAFASDRAFRFEMLRRVRSASGALTVPYHDQDTGRLKATTLKTLPLRATEVLAGWLVDAYARFAALLIRKEREERTAMQRANDILSETLK